MKSAQFQLVLFITAMLVRWAPAQATLDEQVAAYKKAAEPIELTDFEMHGVADVDNAALALRAAGESVNTETPAWLAYESIDELGIPVSDPEAATFAGMAKENAKAFEQIDLAMTRKSVDWQIKMTSPTVKTLLPHLSQQRMLAHLLQARALLRDREHADGDSIKDVQRILFISRSVDQQGFVVGHLVSAGIASMAAATVEMLSPELAIGAAPAASAEQVKQLITVLLDDAPLRRGQRNAFLLERMSSLDIAQCVISGKITPKELAELMGPRAKVVATTPDSAAADGLLMIRFSTDAMRAFDATADWQSYKVKAPQTPAVIAADPKGHALASIMIGSPEGFLRSHYRCETERHIAAVMLAIRAYAVAHGGKRPAALGDLVPEYFPRVPADPMAVNQPLTYLPEKAIVYSVGEDGTDEGGNSRPDPRPGKRPGPWGAFDAVRHLDRQPRVPVKTK